MNFVFFFFAMDGSVVVLKLYEMKVRECVVVLFFMSECVNGLLYDFCEAVFCDGRQCCSFEIV